MTIPLFSAIDGHLYELDGRKKYPINHGPCNADEVLEKACAVVRSFMERDPEELRFTMLALAAPDS
jgi:ubiquitin carboxyl-terminal hydrolase L3